MFKKLRNKLKSWTESLSKDSETEESTESETKKPEETKKSEKKAKKEPAKKKKEKTKKDSGKQKKGKKSKEKDKEKSGKESSEKKEQKEISPQMKFNVAEQKYEPDLEQFQEQVEEEIEKTEKETKDSEKSGGGEEEKDESEEDKETDKEEKKKKGGGFLGLGGGKGRKVKITEKIFEEYSEDLEMILLENNVALEVSEKIIESLKEEIVGQEFSKKEVEEKIYETMKESIKEILVDPYDVVEKIKNKSSEDKKPYVILFCGVNGTGKTTSIAKISKLLEKEGLSSVLAAGDTFRAASIEQLKKHGQNLGKEVIAGSYGSDPASVGFDAIKYAEKNNIDAVLIDTAGRMYTNKNLMSEIEKVSRVCEPDLKLFVGESTTGNDALEQVKAFNESIGIDGIVLAKADIDEKGGTALSVGYVTGKPILYLGTGQEYKDIEPFDKEKFVEKLFSE